ncbi:MAG: hypothetical protein R3B95_06715 [Nitrospirales bacterium]|nr:hypothetical protein [Nitrospirales bacterium]
MVSFHCPAHSSFLQLALIPHVPSRLVLLAGLFGMVGFNFQEFKIKEVDALIIDLAGRQRMPARTAHERNLAFDQPAEIPTPYKDELVVRHWKPCSGERSRSVGSTIMR